MQVDWTGIIFIATLILINAFFAASEIAVISTRRVKVEKLKEEGHKSAPILLKLMEDPSRFLATIQIGITLAGFLASATAAVGLSLLLAQYFQKAGIPVNISNSLGVFTITLAVSYVTLVLGELAPKRLAMQWAEKIALRIATPINFLARATFPITRFLTFSTNAVVRLLGGNPRQQEKEISEDEIRLYIAEHRSLPREEKRMIEAVFDFGDQVVRQVMVPRTELLCLHAQSKVEEALKKACSTGFFIFPVYRGNLDDIKGMVTIHDLARQVLIDHEQKVEYIMTPALFVPETKNTIELLKEFRQKNLEAAIIVDEYGGITGLITLDDLVDEIIGDVIDEQKFIQTSPGQWLVEGDTPMEEITETFNLKRIPPTLDYETIAGFLLKQLGHLPREGETVLWEGYKFQVKEIGARRIKKVLITLQ